MRLSTERKRKIQAHYPDAMLARIGAGWFLFGRASREDPDGWPPGWHVRQIVEIDALDRIWLCPVAKALKSKRAATVTAKAALEEYPL